ncbi:MAG: SPOR domain-containing protein [Fibrobacter sp.]|jgi:hypothetical protein|nr:SPOR domain-containing protein [Fibrobacter sp.]
MIFFYILFLAAFAAAQSVSLDDAHRSYVAGNWKQAAGQFENVCPSLAAAEQAECALWGILALSQTGNSADFKRAKERLDSLISKTSPQISVYSDLYMTKSQFELYLKQPEKALQSWSLAFESATPRQYGVLGKVCENLYKQHPKPEVEEACKRLENPPAAVSSSSVIAVSSASAVLPSPPVSSAITELAAVSSSSMALSSSSQAVPVSSAAAVAAESWVLQLGVFGLKENAVHQAELFKNECGVPVQIAEKTADGKTRYVIQTEAFPSREAALEYGARVLKPLDIDFFPIKNL